MVNVFGESVGNGPVDLQIVKKVVVTKGQYKDYVNEIRQSYELGFPPCRLHTNDDGTFVTPIRVYDGRVYVLDDVATMNVGEWFIEAVVNWYILSSLMMVVALLRKEIEDPLELGV